MFNTKTPTKAQPEAGTVHWLLAMIERGSSSVTSEVTMVTPGLAAELLRRNDGNRGIKSKVNQYAADMRSGRWTFNGEPIIVSDTGELNDGQHRMLALIDANISLPFLFVFGLSRQSRETVDQGSARGAGDYLSMGGMKNANISATIARLVLAYEASDGKALDTKPITNAQVVARAKSDSEIHSSAQFTSKIGRHGALYAPSTIYGFCHYLFSEIDKQEAEDYLTQVSTGEGLKKGSPAISVRERLLSTGKSRQQKVAIIMRGWNFYRRDMKVRTSSLPGTMPLPALL